MINRIFVEKKKSVNNFAEKLRLELNTQLNLKIKQLRYFIRYDIEGLKEEYFDNAVKTIFSEPPVDDVYLERLPELKGYSVFATQYLPGQYDLRADSASQCVQLLTMDTRPDIRCASVYAIKVNDKYAIKKIQNYLVNPIDSRIAEIAKPKSLAEKASPSIEVRTINNFRNLNKNELDAFRIKEKLAMNINDIQFIQDYFIKEKRDPTETEIRVIDTYWSDHCRHTTFLTELSNIDFYTEIPDIKKTYNTYLKLFSKHSKNKYPCLMDIATMASRELKSKGYLKNFDESEEINACSIKVKAKTNKGIKDYLVMFKNETHNHPTEIEPFGGAATCLGGAIRDPLAGRAFVFQAMRISGAADITQSHQHTPDGKLAQRLISKEAAKGFSSYGNQIGLATGMVAEIYHPDYIAKRLEAGFVVGAVPAENVIRQKPLPGDLILLIGGDTGRDGCGGATGSSKEHNEESIKTGSSEVQKGNPITERKIQRLFFNSNFSTLVKRCNDFGAGGACVALGELADGIKINLDAIRVKYKGLGGTELAISESQERMAIVISKENLGKVNQLCKEENLQAAHIADVTNKKEMAMSFKGKEILNLKRTFLASNGVKQKTRAIIKDRIPCYMNRASKEAAYFLKKGNYAAALQAELSRLNVTSNKGMGEMFDSTIGAGSVYMPYGGIKQLTPALAMAAKLPVYPLETETVTVSSWGFDPYLTKQSPFIGAQYSVLLSVVKLCASGAAYNNIVLSFQEYFKKLFNDPERWGEPLAAMLGALKAQLELKIAAIGGKDSMSGSFLDMDVPPTFISFSLAAANRKDLISNVLYKGAKVYRISLLKDNSLNPNYTYFKKLMKKLNYNIKKKNIDFCTVVESGGAVSAIAKSCLGNNLGFKFNSIKEDHFFPRLGDILIAGDITKNKKTLKKIFGEFLTEYLGEAGGDNFILSKENSLSTKKAETSYLKTLSNLFPLSDKEAKKSRKLTISQKTLNKKIFATYKAKCFASPKVLIPVFPGTNCEYDTSKKFLNAGAKTEIFVFNNFSREYIKESVLKLSTLIKNSQIIAIPGGFSGGDEPDGSAKFIAAVFRSPLIEEAINEFLEINGGLILGICNGFQALIKLGLLPYGKISPLSEKSATLHFNSIGHHISSLCAVRITSTDTPWLSNAKLGDTYLTAISHGEGRLIASDDVLLSLKNSGRICTQYLENLNGSMYGIEGLISPCGRILGQMGHSERSGKGLYINVMGKNSPPPPPDIFKAGTNYFK